MRKRFFIALIFAIFPFAVLSAGQAFWRLEHAHELARQGLIDAARSASAPISNTITAAQAVLRALEHQDEIRTAGPQCAQYLSNTISGSSYYTNLFRVNGVGIVTCSATPVPADMADISGQSWWQDANKRGKFILSEEHYGRLSKQNILTAALPLFSVDGKPDGLLALGLRSDFLINLLEDAQLPADAVAALIDANGKIIATTNPTIAPQLVKQQLESTRSELGTAKDADGKKWLYAVSDISGQDLRIAFAERESALLAWSYLDVVVNILAPFAMAGFAFAAIWYSANRFVLRWIVYLQRVSRAYGAGHFNLRPVQGTATAPPEIQQLAGTLGAMATSIKQRDTSLRQALDQRSMMLKEIHHRVKNNLQIIASLLQIEARQIKEKPAREALSVTQTRISAIALAHRLLEEVDSQTVVNIRTLVTDLTMLMRDGLGDDLASDEIKITALDSLIDTDIAVPLALFMAEQLTGIYKRALTARQHRLDLTIVLERSDAERLRLTIAYEKADTGSEEPSATRTSFVNAYVRQLRGTLSMQNVQSRSSVEMEFPERLATVLRH